MTTVEQSFFDEFMADPYMEFSNPFGTPEEKKQRNKEANIAACGSAYSEAKNSHSLNWDGSRKVIVITCKYYRECEDCREKKYMNEVEPRLNHGQNHLNLGDRLRFETITEDERQAYQKRFSRGKFQYYAFPQPDDKLLIIHNDPDGSGDELWDFGYDDHDLYNEDNGLDLNFFTILRDVPERKKISGKLGRKQEEPENEGDGQAGDEPETFPIKRPFLYKDGLSERDASIAYQKALVKTLDVWVETEHELQQAMFARINAMASEIKDAVVGYTFDVVTEGDIKLWNANSNNFTSNVQISTNSNIHSSNLDKNHKKSSFEAIKSRADRGDGMDEERQRAIDDYLYHHGT